jgi:signal transduction histidine kinase
MSRKPRWWVVFCACNAIIALALIWTTKVVLHLERSELEARAEIDYQESLRLAMWRMDSWLALLFARESARPSSDYQPAEGADYSPLLFLESDYINLHFEIDTRGNISSPQVPAAGTRVPGIDDEEQAARDALLERYRGYLDLEAVHAAVSEADTLVDTKLADPESKPAPIEQWQVPAQQQQQLQQQQKSQAEFDARVACSVPRPPGEDLAGRQVVVWLEPPTPAAEPALVFLRRTESGGDKLFQGFVLDWLSLTDRLLFEIADLFPEARLERVAGALPVDPLGRGLANIPVTLVAAAAPPAATTWITGGRTALAVAWLAALAAAVAVGATLRKSIDLGERRRRFVSAVTHELRTPLTTFQLYSEMLADGLVPEEQQKQQYLSTLKDESQRLSAMVANVLAHARIEEGNQPRQREALSLEGLLERLRPPLERRVDATPMRLDVAIDGPREAPLQVDVEAIGQILGNLVDNAAKYANGNGSSTIHLGAAAQNGSLVLTVRDHGPGIPPQQASAVFAPFERGGRDPADPVPGVGLGLALARGLARDMGGELTLEAPSGGGALFRLELPARPVS